jgi:hypothetical protein
MEERRSVRTVAPTASPFFPRQVWALLALYALASLIHFVHNAESIALYPNMPAWLTREKVYLAWLAFTGVGVVALAFAAAGWRVATALCLAAYGALGFVGLGHYTLAPHSGHTIAMNLSIWFEAVAGGLLVVSSVRLLARAVNRAKTAPGA